jgi:hypothetical protein
MPYQTGRDLELAYTQKCLDRIARGFQPHLITLMFNPLPSSNMARQMERETERLYANVLTWMFRHPDRMDIGDLPFWVTCPDYPVNKLGKLTLRDASVNDGMHMHVSAIVPPSSRLKLPFNLWLAQNKERYSGPGHAIAKIEVVRIYTTPELAFRYALKSLGRGRATGDDVLVLPRTHDEMR